MLIFTGAGVSKESGVETFRDSKESLWNNHSIEDVATMRGWQKDKKLVLDFYNKRREELKSVEPNEAHKIIAELEKHYDVTIVTQNVDNLHERAGSTNVIHLHGQLNKVRSTMNPKIIYDWFDDVNIGDKCEEGSQLRPHIVWFGEMLDQSLLNLALMKAEECDLCIIVGSSMQVSPANEIPMCTRLDVPIYYVDPDTLGTFLQYDERSVIHLQEVATVGMKKLYNELVVEKYDF